MEIMDEANYYSQANANSDGKKGWSVIINREIVNSNPSVITPEIAEKANAYIQPKESFTNIIDNYSTVCPGRKQKNLPLIMADTLI